MTSQKILAKKKLTDLGKEVEGTKKKKENAKSTSKQR